LSAIPTAAATGIGGGGGAGQGGAEQHMAAFDDPHANQIKVDLRRKTEIPTEISINLFLLSTSTSYPMLRWICAYITLIRSPLITWNSLIIVFAPSTKGTNYEPDSYQGLQNA
jgi:hypothetical protein